MQEQLYQTIRLRSHNQSEDLLESLDVPADELESRARERRIYDVTEFLKTDAFREAGYMYNPQTQIITRGVVAWTDNI